MGAGRRQIIAKPDMALPDYIAPAFQWITFLNLSNVTCCRRDVMSISNLSNIGALTIGKGFNALEGGLDDSIIRAWVRAATETGAFSLLRVLACRGQQQLTPLVLQYITQLPSLAVVVLEDCGIGRKEKPQAKVLGWRYKSGKHLNEFLVLGGSSDATWASTVKACFFQGSRFGVAMLTDTKVDAINALPVLDFTLGELPTLAGALGRQSVCLFFRNSPKRAKGVLPELTPPKKRTLVELNIPQPKTKRMAKAPKQRASENLLAEFGI